MKDKVEDAVDYILSSKTLAFIGVMTLLLMFAFLIGTVMINLLKWESPVSSGELIEAWKWATGAGTTRNIISDGVMPRIPQVVGANKEPSVAVQSPKSMELSNPSVKSGGGYIPPTPPI